VAFFSDRPITGNQYLFRGDQQFSVKDRMFLRVMADDRVTDSAREQLGAAAIRGFKAPFNGFFPSLLLGETHLFSSRFLNDFRMSYARSDFGIAFQVPGQQGGGGYPTLGGFASGVASFGGASLVPRNFVFNDFTWNDSFAATVGRHTVKVGFEVSRVQENSDYKDISYGSYSFTNIFTFANDAPYSTTGLVNPATGQFTSTPRHFRSTEYGAFVQDDWKVTRRLTANLGLRYDYFGSPTETQGILSNIVMGHGSSLAQDVATATVGRVSTLFNASPHNFAPRLGLAFDPAGDGKTSLRASYSMAYLAPYSNLYTNASRFDPPDSAFPLVYPALYGGTISYGVPAIPSPGFLTGLTSSGSIPGTRISVSGVAQNLKTAYSEQWFFGVQRKLPGAFYLSANYVGTAGHQLYIRNDINRFTGDRPSLTVGVVRYNQSWNGTTFVENGSDSIYHGINAQLQKRFGHSSTFTVNYTFGKSIDTVSDPGLGDYSNVAVGIYNGTMDVSKAFLDHGASDFDVRHRLTTNGVWDLPSPKSASWLRTVIGGWQLNGLATFQTGRPFSVVCNSANLCDYNGDGDGYDRPNTPAFGNTLTGLSRSNYIKGLFTVSQFPVPVFGTDGNLGRNTFRGPGFAQVDSSLFKKIPIHEKITLQFRAEVFNVFNRVNLYLPNDSLVSALFGRSTAAFQPRQMQFALKLVF
jgi:outer membrane receptor protein involved in Fe transport